MIDNKKIVTKTKIDVKLDLIKAPKPQFNLRNLQQNNPFIGTIDLETFKHDSISKVYAGLEGTIQKDTGVILFISMKTI